jgi:hypothetical protein
MSSKLQPAFWGGLFVGVLSALPFVSSLNACCCLWVIAGGVLTSYLLQERTMVPITAGDGALSGLLAGVVGAVIAAVLGVLVALIPGMSAVDQLNQLPQGDFPPELTAMLDRVRSMPAWVIPASTLLITLVLYPVFSMLGALLGVAMFKKSVPPPPAPGTVEVLPPEPPAAM